MKKTAIATAVVVISAVAYVAASWAFGRQIEARYSAEVERAMPLLPGTPGVVERGYERGWFTSLATSVIEFELPGELFDAGTPVPAAEGPAPTRTVRLHLQDRLRHGPLPGLRIAAATVESRLVRVEGIDDALRQAFAKAAAPYLDTVFGFDGRYTGRFVLPAGAFERPASRAQWQPLESTFSGGAQGTRVDGRLHWPRALFEQVGGRPGAAPLRVVLDGVQGTFDAEQPPAPGAQSWLLAQGAYKGTIDAITLTREEPAAAAAAPLLALQAVTIDTRTTRDGDLMNSVLALAARGSFGALPIEAIHFDTALERFDAEAAGTVRELLLEQAADSGQATPDNAAQNAAALEQAIEHAVAARPGYRMKLVATIAAESGEIGYSVAVQDTAPKQPPPPTAAAATADPSAALLALLARRIEGDATLRLPRNWLPAVAQAAAVPGLSVQMLRGVLSSFVAQGMLVEDATGYSADLKLAQGLVRLNGQPATALVPRLR